MPLATSNRASLASTRAGACVHCGSAVPDGGASEYCCAGCEAVAALLREEELTRYYTIAGGDVLPVGGKPGARSHAWLEPLLEAQRDADTCTLDLDVQGIHCAACVWLMNETFRRRGGGLSLTVNPAVGKVHFAWRRGAFDPEAWLDSVERFGYQFGPSRKQASSASRSLTWRLGVSAALAMNVMLFSVAFYFGLDRNNDAALHALFSRLAFALSTAVVVVGGWPFLVAAVRGLRHRILHLDLPIALGIILVYATSLVGVVRGKGGELAYFDTLNVFITLMLLGRFLQQRLLERNRQLLLADDGADGLLVRRLAADGRLELARAALVRTGDRLLVAPGELLPVDAELTDAPARVSTDWITGEAEARTVPAGSRLAAGSFNAGTMALTAVARQDFAASPLVQLLRQADRPAPRDARGGAHRHLRFWDGLARRWVVTVMAVATAGFALWWPRAPGRALDVAVALLVVTCPCAIGIALPLAYEIVAARLRRAGFFGRAADVLDRLERVGKVVFDKTGTLTLQRLELVPDGTLDTLTAETRAVAYNLACRSTHPVSACIAAALARRGASYDAAALVAELPGAGLEWRRPDGLWRLGRATWAAPDRTATGAVPQQSSGAVLARDGVTVARFQTREALRGGAAAEIAALQAAGYGVYLLSGDAPARVSALAAALGIPADRAEGGRTPSDKAAALARLGGEDALYLGDGANDALAFGQSLCAGTVAIERPILPGRSDFFIVGESLTPVRMALEAAQALRRVAGRILALAIAYNVVAISVSLAGLMSPLRAAVFMPLSSLSILLYTVAALRPVSAGAATGARRTSTTPLDLRETTS